MGRGIFGVPDSILVRSFLRFSLNPVVALSLSAVSVTCYASMCLMLYGPSTSNLSLSSPCCAMPPNSPILGKFVGMTPRSLSAVCDRRKMSPSITYTMPLWIRAFPVSAELPLIHPLETPTALVVDAFAQSSTAVVRCRHDMFNVGADR